MGKDRTMDLPETDVVKPSDERPARPDGTCFYCGQPVGRNHKPDCVVVSKTVTVRLTLELVIDVPRAWDGDMIEFARNESSWCKDNLLRDLGAWASVENRDRCTCGIAEIKFLRDATAEDHAALPVIGGHRAAT